MISQRTYTEFSLEVGQTITRDIALGYGIASSTLDAWDAQIASYRNHHHYLALGDVVQAARSVH